MALLGVDGQCGFISSQTEASFVLGNSVSQAMGAGGSSDVSSPAVCASGLVHNMCALAVAVLCVEFAVSREAFLSW